MTVDGVAVYPPVYNIDGYNYFKLRDLGTALGFNVEFDEAANTAMIDTNYDEWTNMAADSAGAGINP